MQQSTQNRGQQRALATELDDQPRLLNAVLRAHMETCEFTREKVQSMRQRARECPTYSSPTMVSFKIIYTFYASFINFFDLMWYLLGLKEKNVRVLVKISSFLKYAASKY